MASKKNMEENDTIIWRQIAFAALVFDVAEATTLSKDNSKLQVYMEKEDKRKVQKLALVICFKVHALNT